VDIVYNPAEIRIYSIRNSQSILLISNIRVRINVP
jgi:hypothetical protein